jgi:hypothetical protein
MFDAAHIASNGITVQYVDMGVEYSYKGHTMRFVGEQQQGEVELDDAYYAEYSFNDELDAIELRNMDSDEVFATIANTDEAYEAYVLQVLQAL